MATPVGSSAGLNVATVGDTAMLSYKTACEIYLAVSSGLLLRTCHLGRPNPHIEVRAIATAAVPLGGN